MTKIDNRKKNKKTLKPLSGEMEIKNIGLRVTGQRIKVLEIFEKSANRHLTAEDVYKIMLAKKIEIGLATVYRVLTQFEQAGILQKQFFESNKAVYELNNQKSHYHLVCSDCGSVKEFADKQIEKKFAQIADDNGFVINDSLLYLYVSCNNKAKGDCPLEKQNNAKINYN